MAEPRLISVRSAVIGALGLAFAMCSALAAFDMVHAKRAGLPVVAGSMTPAAALSHRAMALLATYADTGDGAGLSVSQSVAAEALALSYRALERGPMDAAALRNLALLEAQAGNAAQSRAMLAMVEQLTRRDRQANVLLAQDAALAGDLPATLARLDQTLRTSTSARREILPLLYQVLEQPGAESVLATMLAENVNWEGDFWAQAASHKPALEQLAALRIERAQAGYASTQRDDRRLLNGLVEQRLFASAQALVDGLHPSRSARTAILRNGDFDTAPSFAPLDWQLHFDGSLTTDILPGRGQLRIATFSDGGGLAARQLVALDPQEYRIDLRIDESGSTTPEALSLRLTCAEANGTVFRIPLTQTRMTTTFSRPSAQCRYHWFDVMVAPQPDRRENTIVVESIALIALWEEGA